MATKTTIRTARVRRNISLPELERQDLIVPSTRPASLRAESTTLRDLRLNTDDSQTPRDEALSDKLNSPYTTLTSAAYDSNFDHHPTLLGRKPVIGISGLVSASGSNGASNTTADTFVTIETRQLDAASLFKGNRSTTSDTSPPVLSEHEVELIRPTELEDTSAGHALLHSFARLDVVPEAEPMLPGDYRIENLSRHRFVPPYPITPPPTTYTDQLSPDRLYKRALEREHNRKEALKTHRVNQTPGPEAMETHHINQTSVPEAHHNSDAVAVGMEHRNGRGGLSVLQHQVWENRRPTPPPLPKPATSPLTGWTRSEDASLMWRTKAVNAAKLDIFTTLTRSGDDKAPKTATLNIAATQRLIIAYQQRRITSLAATIYTKSLSEEASNQVFGSLLQLIHTHCDAVRDLEFMQQHAADCGENDEDDPFYLKSSKELDRLAMERAELIPYHVLPAGDLPISRDFDHPTLPGVARTAAIKADKSRHLLLRFGMASAGELFLIVPVIVMANVPGKTSSLVTTCIAMLLFALGITFGTDIKSDQVLAATAAYAAVLVVFVGTSLANADITAAAVDVAATKVG